MKKFLALIVVIASILSIMVLSFAYAEEDLRMEYTSSGMRYFNGYSADEYLNSALAENGRNYSVELRFTEDIETSEKVFEVLKGGYAVRTSKWQHHDGCYWLSQDELDRLLEVVLQHW